MQDYILVINSDSMGEDKLIGNKLIRGCIHVLNDIENPPSTIILYNSGVKLFENNTQTYDDLKALFDAGVQILSCGTCIDHFKIDNNIGDIVNMFDIMNLISTTQNIKYI